MPFISDPFFRQIAAIDGDLISPFIHRFSQMLFVPSHAPTTDKYLGGDDNILAISDESAIPAIGSWLVRATSPVPIPAAVWLLASAIASFAMARRRVVA